MKDKQKERLFKYLDDLENAYLERIKWTYGEDRIVHQAKADVIADIKWKIEKAIFNEE